MTTTPGGSGSSDPKTKRVLIVDDDESILNLLEILVQRDGFQVLTAPTGEEAIEKLSLKPDCLLLDLTLGGQVSGLEVLKHLRGLPGPFPPVIIITASSSTHPAVIQAGKDPNVVQCLQKPLRQDILLAAMHRYMGTVAPLRQAPAPGPRDIGKP